VGTSDSKWPGSTASASGDLAAVRARPITCGMLSLLAMPIHPWWVWNGGRGPGRRRAMWPSEGFFKITPWVDSMKLVARTALTALILVAVTLALWSGQGASALSTSEFIDIVARFRHPTTISRAPGAYCLGVRLRVFWSQSAFHGGGGSGVPVASVYRGGSY